jgi:Domain of unknown function (DUF4157)
MINSLINRIKQRLEARRDFMRSVFSKHHALTWRMTDAPSLRAIGLTPKKTEPSRARAVQVPTDAKVQPLLNPRVFEIPDLAVEVFDTSPTSQVTESLIETVLDNSSFELPADAERETQVDSSLEAQVELEPSEKTELNEIPPIKLDPARALEIFERHDSFAIPESRAGVASSERLGGTKPDEVSPRANIEKIVPDGVVIPRIQLDEVVSSEVFKPDETRVLEQNEVVNKVTEPDIEQAVQNTNNSTIEPQSTKSEKIENPQLSQTKPLTAARASEILQQRAAQASQPDSSKAPAQAQKIVPELQNQTEPSVLRETGNQQTPALESNEIARLENQIESNLEPAVVARELSETPQVSAEIPMRAEISDSKFETATEQSALQSTPKPETRETVIEETQVSQVQKSDAVPRETTSEVAQSETQKVIQTPQEPVAQESRQESDTLEIPQEPVAREVPQESITPETSQAFLAPESQPESDSPEAFIARETRTEPQPEAAPSQPLTPEQTNWQRSIPGDPQSGVVEIIRAKPPRNLRPERTEKPTEPREEAAKLQASEAQISQSGEAENPSKQNLSDRMKSLQQRFGANEQTRSDPNPNSISERAEVDETEQTPAPKFQSISDVAQRLSRRYSESPVTTNSSKQENSSPDLKVGQQFNQTQTRAANEFVQQGTQPVQLRESTRTFLAPLIGFDPSQARVFVGASASEFTSSLNADGATVATDVYLNNGFDEQSAEGLGLLAHELTHVGQNLQPDFVPPMLQDVNDQQDLTGESLETQARAVEARVTNTASMFVPGMALEAAASRQTSTAPTAPSNTSRNVDAWNGLPAPWEAIPNLNTKTSDFVTVVNPNASDSSTSTAFTPASDAPSASVQLADADRPSSENPDNQQAGAAAGQAHPPAQDMDLLAQQVYEILKRKLSSERRREG